MEVNKKIILDLLFEYYRTMLAKEALEDQNDEELTFYSDICISGSNIINIVFNILKLDTSSDLLFYELVDPFYEKIINADIESSKEAKIKIEEYFNWLVKKYSIKI